MEVETQNQSESDGKWIHVRATEIDNERQTMWWTYESKAAQNVQKYFIYLKYFTWKSFGKSWEIEIKF